MVINQGARHHVAVAYALGLQEAYRHLEESASAVSTSPARSIPCISRADEVNAAVAKHRNEQPPRFKY